MSEECRQITTKRKLTDVPTSSFNILLEYNPTEGFNQSYYYPRSTTGKILLNTENCVSNFNESNETIPKSEVRFIEDWLMFRLVLIRQQNPDSEEQAPVNEKQIKENEMLRELLNQYHQEFKYLPPTALEDCLPEITQDAAHIEDDKSLIKTRESQKTTTNHYNMKNCSVINDLLSNSDNILNRADLQVPCPADENSLDVILNNNIDEKSSYTLKEYRNSITKQNKNGVVVNNFKGKIRSSQINIKQELHTPRRKRLRRSIIHNEEIIMYDKPYITAQALGQHLLARLSTESDSNVETPTWRIVNYTGCYSIEATEHLDEELFKKRHSKYEGDEQRRKRWDSQRIREQRVVDNLRLRQDRLSSGSANDKSKSVSSLCATPEDVKFIEICDKLPVSAFGSPIRQTPPSEFSLLWSNTQVKVKCEPYENPMQSCAQPHLIPGQLKGHSCSSKPRKRKRGIRRYY